MSFAFPAPLPDILPVYICLKLTPQPAFIDGCYRKMPQTSHVAPPVEIFGFHLAQG
jgi:hypothetical protein